MNIIYKNTDEIKPYEKNPRRNEVAVKYVANSIKEFGFKNPIIIDKNNVIVAGHTRYKASKKLKLKEVPCVIADDLTEEQIKAYRLVDNKAGEQAEWDFDLLGDELNNILNIDMSEFGFTDTKTDFFNNFNNQSLYEKQEDNEEYNEFTEKFKPKLTTDDCYTPPAVYKVVADYVIDTYKVKESDFVRPFYPGGDYQKENYTKDSIVVDNPPFSIYDEIINFYIDNNIKFFLFGPMLTLFRRKHKQLTYILVNCGIVYQNGATIKTAFATNLDNTGAFIKTSHELTKKINNVNNTIKEVKQLTEYEYPKNLMGSTDIIRDTMHKEDLIIYRDECEIVTYLNNNNNNNKTKMFGNKLIVSDAVLERINNLKVREEEKENAEKVEVHFTDEQLKILEELNQKKEGGAT